MRAILTWHSVDTSASVISVSIDQLERQLDAIMKRRIEVVPLTEIVNLPDDRDAVALTFDDGFRNFSELAQPALAQRRMTATVFVVPFHVGGSNDWKSSGDSIPVPLLPLMSWDEIRSASQAGFSIGAHGLTHIPLAGLPVEEIERELDMCNEFISAETGRAPDTFAFPYGAFDSAAVAAASARFKIACTTELAALSSQDSLHALPRLDTYYLRDASLLEKWGSPAFNAHIALRRAGRKVRRMWSV